MSYGTELDKDAIDRINNLFEEGTLDEVKAISVYD
jgi:hypothetical protein